LFLGKLDKIIDKFYNDNKLDETEKKDRFDNFAIIKKIIQKSFKNYKIHLFGYFESSISHKKSDIDIVVLSENQDINCDVSVIKTYLRESINNE